ncbi:MAG: ParB/RepB/Spo0J family partition protein [Clostridiales bacterium]|nr:ParB/RepB/Spo0J family partition protein [Clostridiales bacterium]
MQLMKNRGLYEASRIVYLAAGDILPNPEQPRKTFEPNAMRELASSISRYGILQPLTVRRRGSGYELVSGERRLRAAKLVGLKDVPCIVLDVDSQESSILALVENLQRRDLDFIEEAEGLHRLVNINGYKQEEIARLVGLSQSAVSNKLRILKLSPELLFMIRETGLTERHARALLKLGEERDRLEIFDQIIKKNLNVANTEALIESFLMKKDRKNGTTHKPVYVLKDVRLFMNTLTRGMSMMQQSGIDARCGRDETDQEIILTIKIPKTNK